MSSTAAEGDGSIPSVIHYIWLGPRPLPEEFEPFVASWRAHHPDWTHRLWTEGTLPEGLRPEVYERLRHPAERADILRLELLAREGGVYVDTDFECLRPIDNLLAGVELFAAEYKDGRINNAILGARPSHPLLVRGLAELRPLDRYGPFDKEATGPFFVDRLFRGSNAVVFPRRLFYPTWEERPGAYAFHHMARSWKDEAGYRRSIQLANERLARAELRPRRHALASKVSRARRKAARILEPHVDVALARLRPGRRRPTQVPRVLHHVWVEPGPLPPGVAAHLETWRICHPDWEQQLWREGDLPGDPVRLEALDPLRSPAEREELWRLELVARLGGVAADLRLACRRRLDGAIGSLEAFAAATQRGPDPALVGATRGHPALRAALEAAEPFGWHAYPAGKTGSRALEAGLAHGLTLLEPQLIDPAGARARARALCVRDRPPDLDALRAELKSVERRLRLASSAGAATRAAP